MPVNPDERLIDHFRALHAEREASWEPDKLRRNIDQRKALVAAFDPQRVVRPGDRVEELSLESSDGELIGLEELLASGPAVLIFFRFAGCPACNLALPYYDRQLRPALEAAGISLTAVSPHLVENGLGDIKHRHGLGFTVAADRNNALGRRFGLTFVPDDGSPPPTDGSSWIGSLTGTGTWELPQPAVVVIGQDRIVKFVDVSPDWLDRTEAPTVLAALEKLLPTASAAAA